MTFENKIKNIRKHLYEEAKLPQAFDLLSELLHSGFEHKQAELATLRGTYHKNESDFGAGVGIITRDTYMLEYRRILRQFEELLGSIEREERLSKSGHSKKGAEITRFSCDRREILKRFWRAFDRREEEKQSLHFYFLAAQPYGQADSLVKRLISDLKEEKKKVKFAGFKQLNLFKIIIDETDSVGDIQYEMRKQFNKKLNPQVKNLSEFAQHIDHKFPAFQSSDFIPLVYRLEFKATCWDRAVIKSLQWFVNQFCDLEGQFKRRFIFFFIIRFKNETNNKSKKSFFSFGRKKSTGNVLDIYDKVKPLEKLAEEKITVLPPLTKVKREDLDNWFQFYESNQTIREDKVNRLIKDLGSGNEWHMSDVEKELKKIVSAYQNAEMGI